MPEQNLQYDARHAVSVIYSGAVSKHRFVSWAGAHATDAASVQGVSEIPGPAGKAGSLVTGYSYLVEAAAAIPAGSAVAPSSDGTGRAIVATGLQCGRALTAAAAAGELLTVCVLLQGGGLTPAKAAASDALVSGDWNANQQAVIDAGGGLVVADDAGNLTGPGGAIPGGGGGGSSTFAGLSDKTTADIPATNTPTAAALGLKAPIASPTFTGTPAAPTASPGTNTTQIATTAFVLANAGSVLGPYADTVALQTAKPAASNGGRVALVGASAPYAPYMSDGSTWGSLSQSGGDPYVAIATSGTSQSINVGSAGVVDITLTANCTLSFTGAISGSAFSLRLIVRQDSTGSRTITWPASTKWTLGAAPTLSTPANSIDEVVLMTYDGGTTFFGDFVARGRA